ncbi:uncharacterized protein LOC135502778 [Lineus longissimus]|uniref:uncharacterized protein LOC135502778 n=1 Tax=Lineus longissimus TaxID=88925 RepID=UPI002B4F7CBE
MKYLAIVLTLFVCGAVAQLGGFEDLLTPEERTEADRVKSFSHYLTEGTELEEPYQSALEETLNIVGIGESQDLEFESTKGNTTRKFKCKNNKCSLCFSVRRFGRGRKIKICLFVGKRANNLTLVITRGKRVVLSGSTPANNIKPICKKPKCPLFGPFCLIFTQVTKTATGNTGCLVAKATIFKKKVMMRQVGCFNLTDPKPDLDLGLPGSDLSGSDAYRKKMFEEIFNKILKKDMNAEEQQLPWAPIF